MWFSDQVTDNIDVKFSNFNNYTVVTEAWEDNNRKL